MSGNMMAVGNEELIDLAPIGKTIVCPMCGKNHRIRYGTDSEGNTVKTLAFYKCRGKAYLGGLAGKDITPLTRRNLGENPPAL